MKVRTFTLNSKKEIISKITREVLTLFKVEVIGREGAADLAQLSVVNHRLPVDGEPREGAKVSKKR